MIYCYQYEICLLSCFIVGTGPCTICDLCGARVKGRGKMKKHIFRNHTEAGKNQTIPCNTCGMLFRSEQTLQAHFKSVHVNGDVKPWSCMFCVFSCKRKKGLGQHLRLKHKMTLGEASEEVAKIDLSALQARFPGIYLI